MRRLAALLVLPLALLLPSCSDDDGDRDAKSATTTSSDDNTSTTAAAMSPTLTPFPAENTDLFHGGDTWAVVLAGVSRPAGDLDDDPVLEAAEQVARDAGYATGATDCDAGAPEALGFGEDADIYTVSVYLRTKADAEQALRAFHERGFEGGAVALLQTYCMD